MSINEFSLLKKGLYCVKNKDSKSVRFIRNSAQRDFNDKRKTSPKKKRIIVKARQLGFTTDACLTYLDRAMTRPYYSAFIVADTIHTVSKIFQDKIKFPFETLPTPIKNLYKTKNDNSNELRFANTESFDSYVRVGTSARGTTVEDLHITEAGLIGSDEKDWIEVVTGSFNAAQDITLEGTADGLNFFYDKVMEEKDNPDSEWDIYFYNWTWAKEYSLQPPENEKWKQDYKILAQKYGLHPNPDTEYGLTQSQFFWYYNKAKDQKDLMVQEFPLTLDEAFKAAGNSIFNHLDIQHAIDTVSTQYTVESGVTFYKKPQKGKLYLIGVDPSTGEGDDDGALSVFQFDTLEQVAQISGKLKPEELAKYAYNLAKYYNNAVVAIETNGNGYATHNEFMKYNYINTYVEVEQNSRNPNGTAAKYGWQTDARSRPVMINEFRSLFEDQKLKMNSLKSLNQMKTFVRKKTGKIEHEDGKHDDCLFADMIAVQARKFYQSGGKAL